MSPVRIQRSRTKGWRMPVGAVYVGRPSRWGNPFAIAGDSPYGNWLAVRSFQRYAEATFLPASLAPLRGRDLACWCPLDQPCHADVLLELANR